MGACGSRRRGRLYIPVGERDRKSTRLNSSHSQISYAVFCLKKKINEWEAFKKVISRRNIRRRITIPLTLSNLKLLKRITRTEDLLARKFTRQQVAIERSGAN